MISDADLQTVLVSFFERLALLKIEVGALKETLRGEGRGGILDGNLRKLRESPGEVERAQDQLVAGIIQRMKNS